MPTFGDALVLLLLVLVAWVAVSGWDQS